MSGSWVVYGKFGKRNKFRMIYEDILKKVIKIVKEDYKKIIDLKKGEFAFERKLDNLQIVIDKSQQNFGKINGSKITLNSEKLDNDLAFLIIYHEILHCVFYSINIGRKFMDSLLRKNISIHFDLINIIQDVLLDAQIRIKYGHFKRAWIKLNKTTGRYKALGELQDKIDDFIIRNKINLELVDLEKMQEKILEELRDDIVKNWGKKI